MFVSNFFFKQRPNCQLLYSELQETTLGKSTKKMSPKGSTNSWREEEEKRLIAFYSDNPVLWHPKHPNYYKREVREDLLAQLKEQLQEECGVTVTVTDLKSKFKNLRSSYIREQRKITKSKLSAEAGEREVHRPKWIHFGDLHFLHDIGDVDNSLDSTTGQQGFSQAFASEPGHTLEDHVGLQMMHPEVFLDEQTSSTASSERSAAASQKESRQSPVLKVTCTDSSASVASEASPHLVNSTQSHKKLPVDEARVQFFTQASRVLQETQIDMDAEDYFAKHVALTLKRLPNTQREDAKLDIQTVLAKYVKKNGE